MYKYEVVKFVVQEFKQNVNISVLEKTIWINIEHIAILLERERSIISKYIKISLNEEKINSQRNLRKTQIANSDKLVHS